MSKKEVNQPDQELSKYQKKTDREHILDNPDTYIGSVELIESNESIDSFESVESIDSIESIESIDPSDMEGSWRGHMGVI